MFAEDAYEKYRERAIVLIKNFCQATGQPLPEKFSPNIVDPVIRTIIQTDNILLTDPTAALKRREYLNKGSSQN